GARLRTGRGTSLFLKWNASAPRGMFAAEADGLRALAATRTVRVPEPLAWGEGERGEGWLLLEHVEPAPAAPDTAERLGRALAALHGAACAPSFGWERDNWLGTLPQPNAPASDWGRFFRERRLEPRLHAVRAAGRLRDAVFDRVLDLAEDALSDAARPSMLHGDLWGGNWFATAGGEPVLVDPAVYRGHGEVDLAMSELFGGFDPAFYEAYREARGLDRDYAAYRRDLYQLYYLLAHVELFGSAYEAGCRAAARRVVARLGS
ncbi:MAG TPA: fructosamine kinase family protein, partial [Longimicrobiales bacterium]|nr:fructosamine kinase family protein [Longimicrobiales bacterium]